MTALVYPVAHFVFQPNCYGCWFMRGVCGEVCNACGCRWDVDSAGEPNRKDETCDGCDCHTWMLVDSRFAEVAEDALETAWKDAGYHSSFEVWQAESR